MPEPLQLGHVTRSSPLCFLNQDVCLLYPLLYPAFCMICVSNDVYYVSCMHIVQYTLHIECTMYIIRHNVLYNVKYNVQCTVECAVQRELQCTLYIVRLRYVLQCAVHCTLYNVQYNVPYNLRCKSLPLEVGGVEVRILVKSFSSVLLFPNIQFHLPTHYRFIAGYRIT